MYSNRLNLGKLRADENALWSLGAHDVSVVLRLAGEEPFEFSAFGESYMREGVEDVVFCYLRFPSGLAAHLHLSWLDPHKERRLTVVGSAGWRRSTTCSSRARSPCTTRASTRARPPTASTSPGPGDIWSPSVPNDEPLRIECRHFAECVRTGAEPRSGADSGLRVVRVLESLQESLDSRSAAVGT